MLLVRPKYLEQIEPLLGDESPTIQHVVVIGGDGRRRPAPSLRRPRRRGADRRAADVDVDEDATALAALHERHDRVPQGRHAHPPQPDRRRAGRR